MDTRALHFSVVKEKLIKTSEVIEMYKESNSKLKKLQLMYKDQKNKFEQASLSQNRLQLENDRLNDSVKSLENTNNKIILENKQLIEQYTALKEQYNKLSVNSQSSIQSLENDLRLSQELQSNCNNRKNQKWCQEETCIKNRKKISLITLENDDLCKRLTLVEEKLVNGESLISENKNLLCAIKNLKVQIKSNENTIKVMKDEEIRKDQDIERLRNDLKYLELQLDNTQLENSKLSTITHDKVEEISEVKKRKMCDSSTQTEHVDNIYISYGETVKLQEETPRALNIEESISFHFEKSTEAPFETGHEFLTANVDIGTMHEIDLLNMTIFEPEPIEIMLKEMQQLPKMISPITSPTKQNKETQAINTLIEPYENFPTTGNFPMSPKLENISGKSKSCQTIPHIIVTPFASTTKNSCDCEILPTKNKKNGNIRRRKCKYFYGMEDSIIRNKKIMNRRKFRERVTKKTANGKGNLLSALRTLKESNIHFTIYNEPPLRNWPLYATSTNQVTPQNPILVPVASQDLQNITLKTQNCFYSHCNNNKPHYMMLGQNDELIGFFNVKKEITISRNSKPDKYERSTALKDSDLDTIVQKVMEKIKERKITRTRERSRLVTDSFESETETEIERLFETPNNDDILERNRLLLKRAQDIHSGCKSSPDNDDIKDPCLSTSREEKLSISLVQATPLNGIVQKIFSQYLPTPLLSPVENFHNLKKPRLEQSNSNLSWFKGTAIEDGFNNINQQKSNCIVPEGSTIPRKLFKDIIESPNNVHELLIQRTSPTFFAKNLLDKMFSISSANESSTHTRTRTETLNDYEKISEDQVLLNRISADRSSSKLIGISNVPVSPVEQDRKITDKVTQQTDHNDKISDNQPIGNRRSRRILIRTKDERNQLATISSIPIVPKELDKDLSRFQTSSSPIRIGGKETRQPLISDTIIASPQSPTELYSNEKVEPSSYYYSPKKTNQIPTTPASKEELVDKGQRSKETLATLSILDGIPDLPSSLEELSITELVSDSRLSSMFLANIEPPLKKLNKPPDSSLSPKKTAIAELVFDSCPIPHSNVENIPEKLNGIPGLREEPHIIKGISYSPSSSESHSNTDKINEDFDSPLSSAESWRAEVVLDSPLSPEYDSNKGTEMINKFTTAKPDKNVSLKTEFLDVETCFKEYQCPVSHLSTKNQTDVDIQKITTNLSLTADILSFLDDSKETEKQCLSEGQKEDDMFVDRKKCEAAMELNSKRSQEYLPRRSKRLSDKRKCYTKSVGHKYLSCDADSTVSYLADEIQPIKTKQGKTIDFENEVQEVCANETRCKESDGNFDKSPKIVRKRNKPICKMQSNVLKQMRIKQRMYNTGKKSTSESNSDNVKESAHVNNNDTNVIPSNKRSTIEGPDEGNNEKVRIVQNILIKPAFNSREDRLHPPDKSLQCVTEEASFKQQFEENNINSFREDQSTNISESCDTSSGKDILSQILADMDKTAPAHRPPKVQHVPRCIDDKEWRKHILDVAEVICNIDNGNNAGWEMFRASGWETLTFVKKYKLSPKAKVLLEKLLSLPEDKDISDDVIQQFKHMEVENVVKIIMSGLLKDTKDIPDPQHFPASLMTRTQRTFLALMVRLECKKVTNLMNSFLDTAQKLLLRIGCNVKQLVSVTRLYVGICKLRGDVHRIRVFCCEAFYRIGDLALPLFFAVLTAWPDIFPHETNMKNYPLAKVIFQIINLKEIKIPCYKLRALRFLLKQEYGYPLEKWDCDKLFEEISHAYLNSPNDSTAFALKVFCRNKDSQWVMTKIDSFFKPLIYKIPAQNVNFKATVILLLGSICQSFSLNKIEDEKYLLDVQRWFNALIEDETPDLVKRSVVMVLDSLGKKKKKIAKTVVKKTEKDAQKQTIVNKIQSNMQKKRNMIIKRIIKWKKQANKTKTPNKTT